MTTAGLVAALVLALAGPAAGATPRQVHGADAVFVGDDVSVVWSVLRGGDETSTLVVITVTARAAAIGAVAAEGVDPFSSARVPRAEPVALTPGAVLRVPRGAFADHPRTELLLAPGVDDLRRGRSVLIVYFSGIPDATPEFTDERARAAWVDGALAGRR